MVNHGDDYVDVDGSKYNEDRNADDYDRDRCNDFQ